MNRARRPRATRPRLSRPSASPAGERSPAPSTGMSRWRPAAWPRLLPRTIQLCIHCRQSPAGFWVSGPGAQTVRRPWCLSCCQELDRDLCHVTPFDS